MTALKLSLGCTCCAGGQGLWRSESWDAAHGRTRRIVGQLSGTRCLLRFLRISTQD